MSRSQTSTAKRKYEEECLCKFAQREKGDDFYELTQVILSAPEPVKDTVLSFLKYKIEFIKENNGIASIIKAYNNALIEQRKRKNAKNRQPLFEEFRKIIKSHFEVELKDFNQLEMM